MERVCALLLKEHHDVINRFCAACPCEGLKQIHRGDFVSLSRQVLPIVLSDVGILSIIGVL